MKLRIFLFSLILLYLSSIAHAVTIYVAVNGDDARSCTTAQVITTPRRTIAGGINCLTSGSTLFIRAGTYVEAIDANTITIPAGANWNSPTTISAYQSETVNTGGWHVVGPYLVLNGIHIDWSIAHSQNSGFAIRGDGSHVKFQNGEVKNAKCSPAGVQNPGCQGIEVNYGVDDYQILNSSVHDNGVNGHLDHNFYVRGPNCLIENNDIYNGSAAGIQLYTGGSSITDNCIIRGNRVHNNGVAAYLYNGQNIQVYNNIFYNNNDSVTVGGGAEVKFYNNTVYNIPNYGVLAIENTIATVRNNILYQTQGIGGAGSITTCSNCNLIGGTPAFVNPGAADFHLNSNSQAIDIGVTGLANYDLDNVSRPQGCCYDAGAYERAGAGLPATKIVVSIQPQNAGVNQVLLAWTVQAQDINGNVVPGYNSAVTITLSTNPTNATLSGTVTGNFSSGVKTFSGDLRIDKEGNGYRFTASSGTLTPAVSNSFSITSGSTGGITRYVSTAGNDSNTCTQSQNISTPRATIQQAIACMGLGDILLIRGGTYAETIDDTLYTLPSGTNFTNAPFISAYQNETVNIGAVKVTATGDKYLIFNKLHIDYTLAGTGGRGYFIAGGQTILQDSEVKNATGDGVRFDTGATNNQVLRTHVHNNSGDGVRVAGPNNVVDGNNIHDNTGFGVDLFSGTSNTNNVRVSNNIVFNQGYGASGIAMLLWSGNTILAYNNIVYHSDGGMSVNHSPSVLLFNNTIYDTPVYAIDIASDSGAGQAINNLVFTTGGINNLGGATLSKNLSVDPHYTNPGAADFTLQSDSIAKDFCTSLNQYFTTDILGVARPQNGVWDCGAYEFVPGSPTPPVANFSTNPSSGNAPLLVTFTDTSTGQVSTWIYSFGDGNTSTLQNPTHYYVGPGIYTPSLIVTGPNGTGQHTGGSITVNKHGTTGPFFPTR